MKANLYNKQTLNSTRIAKNKIKFIKNFVFLNRKL